MKIDVNHIAKLSNLPLKQEEKQELGKQLEETLEYIENLNDINTEGVEPTSQVTGLENVSRGDKTSDSLSQEAALQNAKSTERGFFKVKGALSND